MPRLSLLSAVSALALAATLSACKTVGPDFERPAAASTPGYLPAGEAAGSQVKLGEAVAADWWRYLGSPELDEVMRMAVEGNPSLQAADASLAAAQAQIAAARAQALPQVNATAGVTGQRLNLAAFGFDTARFQGIDPNPTLALYQVGANVSYGLDLWGLNKRTVEAAEARAENLARQADAAYLSLTGNVAIQAAQIAAIKAQIDVVQAIIADDQRLIDLARKAEAAGAEAQGPQVDAKAQLAADTALLPPLRQDLATARHALSVLVGKAPAEWTPPDFDLAHLTLPQAIPVSLPSALVRQRPDILAAEARLHAATADVGVATAQLYPNINLTGSITQEALSPEKLFSFDSTVLSAAANLTAPLFDGGRRRAQREATRETARAALATYQATVIQAFGQVADLMQALAHDEERIATDQSAVETAQESLRLARAAYDGGATGFLPVVDAERRLNAQRLTQARNRAQRYLHAIQLFAATGAGIRGAAPARSPPAA